MQNYETCCVLTASGNKGNRPWIREWPDFICVQFDLVVHFIFVIRLAQKCARALLLGWKGLCRVVTSCQVRYNRDQPKRHYTATHSHRQTQMGCKSGLARMLIEHSRQFLARGMLCVRSERQLRSLIALPIAQPDVDSTHLLIRGCKFQDANCGGQLD